ARYNPDGNLDTSFGASGIVTSSLLDRNVATVIAIQADSKIIAAGRAATGSTDLFALARYNPDGNLDTTFGNGGLVTTRFLELVGGVRAVAFKPDGKIVAAGIAGHGARAAFVGVARYNSDGSLDLSFGTDGKVVTEFLDSESIARVIVFKSNDKIVVAGTTFKSKGSVFALARYNGDGSPDTSFGVGGKVVTSFTDESDDDANAVAIQPDGKIIAAGMSYDLHMAFGLARYDAEPGFALALNPATINAERGTKVRVTLNINRTGGFAGNLTITPSDTSSLNIRVTPDSVSTTDATASFRVKIKGNASTGLQQITFTGKDDLGRNETATLRLIIQ